MKRLLSVALFLILLSFAKPVHAHWADMAALELDVNTQGAQGYLSVPAPFFLNFDDNRNQRLEKTELKAHLPEIKNLIQQHLRLQDDHMRSFDLQLAERSHTSKTQSESLSFVLNWKWASLSGPLRLEYDWFPSEAPEAHCLVSIQDSRQNPAVTQSLVFDSHHPSHVLDKASPLQQIHQFVVLGLEHIVTGYDHLLFLLALLLVSNRLPYLLKIVTSFTLAHSITLSLATLQWVQVPSRWVESLIALSIVYVIAVEVLWKRQETPWYVVFGFGLIHGLGFASLLGDLLGNQTSLFWPLLSFNLGLELGQLFCIAVMWGTLKMLQRVPLLQRSAQWACSIGVMGIALYWFVERAFLNS